MALIELRGLRGLAGLSYQERLDFLNSHGLNNRGLTFQEKDRAYKDYLYQQYFGTDVLDGDPELRDKFLFDTVVQDYFDKRYKGVASDDEYNLWNSLTSEGKYEFLLKPIMTSEELDKYELELEEYLKKKEQQNKLVEDDNLFIKMSMSAARAENPMLDPWGVQVERGMVKKTRGNQEEWIRDIFERDKLNVLGEAAVLTNQLYDRWLEAVDNGQMSYEDIDREFAQISPYLNHYNAFLGEEELKNFSSELKMNALAQYYAVLQLTGNAATAISAVDGGILNYVAGQQDGWDKTKLFLGNLVTGTVGAIMNEVNGLVALGAGAVSAMVPGGNDFEKGVAEFLGSDWALYWDGVDNFNSFAPSTINKARENGGVSPNQRIRAIGTEHDIDLNTAYDMGAMAKFIIPALLSKGTILAALSGTGRIAAKSLFKAAVRKGISKETAKILAKTTSGVFGVAATLESGVGISNAYAMGTYNEALAENNQKIDQLVDNHIEQLIKDYEATGGSRDNLTDQDYALMKARAEQELNVDRLREEAQLAATDAYIVNATMEAPRMALENALFRKWMLSKGTKANLGMDNPYLRVANVGGELTMLNKWQNRLKPLLSNVWGGFESNYMDDVTARFGKEWGLANFNNYIVNSYDPTQYAGVVEGYMNPLIAAGVGAKEAFGEEQSFWDGFIGAGGSLIQLAPSGRWASRAYQNRKAKAEGRQVSQESRSFLEHLNDYIYNPILQETEAALQRERNTSDRITAINKLILDNKDNFDDIVNLAIADSRAVLGARSGDMLTAADGKTLQLFELVHLYNKMKADPIAREHTQVKQIEEMLQRVTEAEDISDILDLVLTSMARPENQGTHAVTAEETFQAIKDNAERFTGMLSRLQEVDKMFDETFDERTTPEILKKQLAYQLVMGENWEERRDRIVEELGLDPAYYNDMTAQLGGRKGKDVAVRAQTQVVKGLEEAIEDARDELEGIRRDKGLKKKDRKTQEKMKLQHIETLERAKQEAQLKLQQIEEFDADNVDLITSDQMRNLSLEDQAALLDPSNAQHYSAQQLVEINAYRDELLMRDPEALQKISDAAELNYRVDRNRESYNRLITSPYEASIWAAEMDVKRMQDIASNVREKRIALAMQDIADKVATGQSGLSEIAVTYSPEFIDEFISRNPYMEDTLTPVKETSLLVSDLTNYISVLENLNDQTRAGAIATVRNVAKGATTAQEVVSRLERALLSDQVSQFDKDILNLALDKAEQLGLQRSATVDRTQSDSSGQTDTTTPLTPATDSVDAADVDSDTDYTGTPPPSPENLTSNPSLDSLSGTTQFGEGYYGSSKNPKKGTFTANRNGDEVKFTIGEQNKPQSIPLQSSDWQLSEDVDRAVGMTEYDLELGITQDTPFYADRIFKSNDGKWYAEGNFVVGKEDGLPERTSQVVLLSDSFDLGNTVNKFLSERNQAYEEKINESKETLVPESPVAPATPAELPAHTPTPEEVVASESAIETPDIDSTGSLFETLSLSDEVALFDILEIAEDEKLTPEQLGEKVESTYNPAVDTTEQGNIIVDTDPLVLLGNKYPGYDYALAADEGILAKPVSMKAGDRMDTIHKWLESQRINLQDIIDNELHAILQVQPEIHYLGTKYTKSGDYIFDSMMLVVPYTPDVARIHNESNGGIINANGKQWLLVGISGYDGRNNEQGKYYREKLKEHKSKRNKYFSRNPSEQFFVDESEYTEMKDMASGRVIRLMSTDTPVQLKSISELFVDDPAINPFGVRSLGELHWLIQYASEPRYVNPPTTGIAYPPTDASSNTGAVFVMMEAANGNFIPAAIETTMYNDIKEGRLKKVIDATIANLFSPKLSERLKAVTDLMKLFNLDKNGKWVLVGNESHDTVTFVDKGVEVARFDLRDPSANYSSMDLMEAWKRLNPRLSITTSVLGNSTALRMYEQAGAFMTDLAKLGTSASWYTVYPIGPDGKPVKFAPPVNGTPNNDANSDYAKAQAKNNTEYYQQTKYRKKGGQWYRVGATEPVTGALAELIEYSNYIRINNLIPDVEAPGRNYFVINSDRNSPLVVRQNSNGTLRVLNAEESIKVLDHIAKKYAQESQLKAIEDALRQEYEGRVPSADDVQTSLDDVDLGEATNLIASLLAGDFTDETNSIPVVQDEEVSSPTRISADSILSSSDINDATGSTGSADGTGSTSPTTAAGIAASELGDRLYSIIEKKVESGQWEVSMDDIDDYVELSKFLDSKGIPISSIDNVENWLQMIEECK